MSSSASTSLSDLLPGTVPQLVPSGLNWAIFSVRFHDAVEAKGYWGHFDGTVPCPTVPPTIRAADGSVTSAPTTEQVAAETQWQKDE